MLTKTRILRVSLKTQYRHGNVGINLQIIYIWFLPLMLLSGLLGALSFAYGPIVYQKLQPQKPEAEVTSFVKTNPDTPTQLKIPVVGIDLTIKEATVSANDWQVFANAASWLKSSGDLSGGNIVIYGHNSDKILGKIIQLGQGQEIILKSGSKTRTFTVTNVYQTSRDDLSQLQVGKDQLTLYTCSGWLDANRFFVIAKPTL